MLLALVGLAATLWAVPAKPGLKKTVTGADGREMTVMLRGDETFHYYITTDGKPVRKQADGTWVEDTRDVKALWKAAKAKRNYHRQQLAEHMRRVMKAPARIGQKNDWTGKKKGLLILVNFKDWEMVNKDGSKAIFDQMLNGINKPYGDNHGSVREYFKAQSYDQFDVEFDVVGPYTLKYNMSHYGGNDSQGNDKAPEEMIYEACNLADSDVNFANYDWDGDGEVENIYVTYAGFGEASGADDDTIWPHQYQLSGADLELELDGVKIDTYACGAELNGTSGTKIDGIGTMCHEYSHCLGLPDFYDIDYSGGHGMFDWDVMDGGSYNDDGYCPAAYTAYEREFCGWLTYTELTSGTNITDMPNIEDNPVAYVVRNDGHTDEYYVLANHQQKGWNKAEAGHGMLIIHVDYDKTVWENNGPNDVANRQRMTIIPADNKFDYETYDGDKYYYGNQGDLWPYKNTTALTDTSTPKAALYNANTDGQKLMHKPIEDITEVDGLISFRFMGGIPVDVPEDLATSNVSNTSFKVTWTGVEDVASYNLKITEKDENAVPATYVKLTAAPDDWEGQYLIVYEAGKVAMNGGLTDKLDVVENTVGVTINNKEIARTTEADAASFTISKTSDGTYSIKGQGGLYMGHTGSNNGLASSSNEIYTNTLSFDGSDATVRSSAGFYLRYNKTSGQDRFRYFKPSTYTNQQPIALYKAQGAPEASEVFTDITGTSYTFTDLTPETQYTVQVQAVDGDGNTSAWSEAVSVTTLAEPVEPTYAKGDVNGDGSVTIADVTVLVNIILSTADGNERADVNGDGNVTIADVTELVNIILGRVQ